jgi:hypothetical protein
MPKTYVITFGGPMQYYLDAVNRLVTQAKQFKSFDVVKGFTDADLKNDKAFWDKHGEFVTNNKKGYGYWIWKPYLIHKTLLEIEEGDYLLYMDSGCEMVYDPLTSEKLIDDYRKLTDANLIIGTTSSSDNIRYSKRDVMEYFGMTDINQLKIRHMQSGCVFIKNCQKMRDLYNEFYQLCHNYHLIDDTPSLVPNDPTFVSHRHDQNVFNVLVQKYGCHNFLFKVNNHYPIHVIRNRSGVSRFPAPATAPATASAIKK